MAAFRDDGDLACPHCAVARAMNEWAAGDGAKAFLAHNQSRIPEAERYPDDQALTLGQIRAMALLMADAVAQLPPDVMEFAVYEFQRVYSGRRSEQVQADTIGRTMGSA